MTDLIVRSQNLMRQYAEIQLLDNSECTTDGHREIIRKSSHSCVSQRDIQRVFTIYEWFMKFYENYRIRTGNEDHHRRAVLVAIGIVYYMRLDIHFREKYKTNIDSVSIANKLKFSKAFNEEVDFFIKKMHLPVGTANTIALKENILATIVCTQTHTPLIIVGEPGSSKTFSFNQTVLNLKGQESESEFFQVFFHSLDPHFYQCSYHTTSNEIETVFSRAINRQRSHLQFGLPTYCVVFMDEAGLPEESHESLKVLHQHLDRKEVSFVAITNHALDAAKTNRAISLFRPKATQSELKILVKGCLCATDSVPESKHADVIKFCQPYLKCMKNEWFSHLFGLRDFHHFIIFLRRNASESEETLSFSNIVHALMRNFSGSEKFDEICNTFMSEVEIIDSPKCEMKKLHSGCF